MQNQPPRKVSPPFWLLTLLSFAGYCLLLFWFPLQERYNVAPPVDLTHFLPTVQGGLAYAGLLCLLFLLMALAYRQVRTWQSGFWRIFLTSALFCAPLIFVYPINANDLYRYIVRGRITAVYAANPFTTAPADIPNVAYLSLTGEWNAYTTPYGPVWEQTAAFLVDLNHASLWVNLLTFKTFAALLHLLIGWLIWHTPKQLSPQTRLGFSLLWLWNPALLLISVADGHNDVLWLFWLMLGYYVQRRGYPTLGLFITFLAPLTKAIAALAIPFFLIDAWHMQPTLTRRLRMVGITGIGGLLMTIGLFRPFGSPLDLIIRLLREVSDAAGFSPAATLYFLLQDIGRPTSIGLIGNLLLALGGAITLILLYRAWQGQALANNLLWIFAIYLLISTAFRLWYAMWLLPWVLLTRNSPASRIGVCLFLLLSQIGVVIHGQLRVAWLQGAINWSHYLAVPLTFILPLAAYLILRARQSSLKPTRLSEPHKVILD